MVDKIKIQLVEFCNTKVYFKLSYKRLLVLTKLSELENKINL